LKYLMIALGGSVGAIARYAVGSYVGNRMGTRFPYGTFLINMSGSFVIGMVMTILAARTHLSRNWAFLVPIGFIGAYTTFSSFELETLRLVQDGQATSALLNVLLSVVVGFVMVWMGVVAGRALP
jgi:CrcB protein